MPGTNAESTYTGLSFTFTSKMCKKLTRLFQKLNVYKGKTRASALEG